MNNSEKIHEETRALFLFTNNFLTLETVFWSSYGHKKRTLTEESDGETAGVLILLAATECQNI